MVCHYLRFFHVKMEIIFHVMGSRFVDANPGSCDKGDVLLIKAARDTEGILIEHISRGRVFFKNGRVFV